MMISSLIADDHNKAAERFAIDHGWGSGATDLVLEMPSAFVGSVDYIVDQMQARRDRYGFSYYVVSDSRIETFSPVVERLAGR